MRLHHAGIRLPVGRSGYLTRGQALYWPVYIASISRRALSAQAKNSLKSLSISSCRNCHAVFSIFFHLLFLVYFLGVFPVSFPFTLSAWVSLPSSGSSHVCPAWAYLARPLFSCQSSTIYSIAHRTALVNSPKIFIFYFFSSTI